MGPAGADEWEEGSSAGSRIWSPGRSCVPRPTLWEGRGWSGRWTLGPSRSPGPLGSEVTRPHGASVPLPGAETKDRDALPGGQGRGEPRGWSRRPASSRTRAGGPLGGTAVPGPSTCPSGGATGPGLPPPTRWGHGPAAGRDGSRSPCVASWAPGDRLGGTCQRVGGAGVQWPGPSCPEAAGNPSPPIATTAYITNT